MELSFRMELCSLHGGKSVMVITGGSADAAKFKMEILNKVPSRAVSATALKPGDAKRCIELISRRSMTFPHLGLTGYRLHFRGSPFEPPYD